LEEKMGKKLTLFLIVVAAFFTGCSNEVGHSVSIDEVLNDEETTANEVKMALNSLDESEDDLSEYKFFKYSEVHQDIVDNTETNISIEAQVDFYYVKKGERLIFVFPPELSLKGNDDTVVDSLFDVSYIMDGNKLVLSTRIHAEETSDETINRMIDMIAISIEL